MDLKSPLCVYHCAMCIKGIFNQLEALSLSSRTSRPGMAETTRKRLEDWVSFCIKSFELGKGCLVAKGWRRWPWQISLWPGIFSGSSQDCFLSDTMWYCCSYSFLGTFSSHFPRTTPRDSNYANHCHPLISGRGLRFFLDIENKAASSLLLGLPSGPCSSDISHGSH